jgi:hypothetical protein
VEEHYGKRISLEDVLRFHDNSRPKMTTVKLKLSSSRKQVAGNPVGKAASVRNKDDVSTIEDLTKNIVRISME